MSSDLNIPLAEAIKALRTELLTAIVEGTDKDLRFALGPIDLELQLEVSKEAGGEAGIKFWVLSVGGKGSRSSGATHTVRLTLTPVSESGNVPVSESGEGAISGRLPQRPR